MIDAMTSAIIQGAINGDMMDTLDTACDHCRAEPPTLSSVQNLLIFPDISADQGKVVLFAESGVISLVMTSFSTQAAPNPKIDPTHAQMDKLTLFFLFRRIFTRKAECVHVKHLRRRQLSR